MAACGLGEWSYWVLGNGRAGEVHLPTRVDVGNDWAIVAAAYTDTIALKQDGTLW